MEEVDVHQRGAIVMFGLIAQCIFERNQESKTAMVNYLTKFDLQNINGQYVPTVALHIRAICRTLGPEVPPSGVHCVLDGMKYASNESFKCICETNIALLSNTVYESTVMTLAPKKNIFSILQDLKTKYLELVESKGWEGIGHKVCVFKLSFFLQMKIHILKSTHFILSLVELYIYIF